MKSQEFCQQHGDYRNYCAAHKTAQKRREKLYALALLFFGFFLDGFLLIKCALLRLFFLRLRRLHDGLLHFLDAFDNAEAVFVGRKIFDEDIFSVFEFSDDGGQLHFGERQTLRDSFKNLVRFDDLVHFLFACDIANDIVHRLTFESEHKYLLILSKMLTYYYKYSNVFSKSHSKILSVRIRFSHNMSFFL